MGRVLFWSVALLVALVSPAGAQLDSVGSEAAIGTNATGEQ